MTDLRKAAEMALEVFEHLSKGESPAITKGELVYEIAALRQALAMENFSEVNQEIEEALKQPRREWVGLTDKEIAKADCIAMDYVGAGDYGLVEETVVEFARAIEAKLKEKNT